MPLSPAAVVIDLGFRLVLRCRQHGQAGSLPSAYRWWEAVGSYSAVLRYGNVPFVSI